MRYWHRLEAFGDFRSSLGNPSCKEDAPASNAHTQTGKNREMWFKESGS
jgi:hypothetical protein